MICFLFLLTIAYIGLFVSLNIKKFINKKKCEKWAFFHPFCNDGGGGEKVLWCMVQALVQNTTHQIAIYSLEESKEAIFNKTSARFGIDLHPWKQRINIIHVTGIKLLTSKGFMTMILHIILPKIYALKCLWKYQPDYFYDTTGYASTLFLVKILMPFSKTLAYVHYPFISFDMINKIKERRSDFNNDASIANSPLKTKLKLVYYQFVFYIYKLNGYFVDFAETNSSWTHGHMKQIWKNLDTKGKLKKLYPPCTVDKLLTMKKSSCQETINIMSLAQFRPQKKQNLQIQLIKELLGKVSGKKKINLKICGTTRGSQDEKILSDLQELSKNLNIEDNIIFVVNQPFTEIEKTLKQSHIGIHTMQAEHFGISIVEMMAAGLIVVAHNSAGPKEDIIKNNQFLAETKADYLEKLTKVILQEDSKIIKLSESCRQKSKQFGQSKFSQKFLQFLSLCSKSSVKNE